MQTKSTLFKTIVFALTGGLARPGFAAEVTGAPPPSQTLYPEGSQQSFGGRPVSQAAGVSFVETG